MMSNCSNVSQRSLENKEREEEEEGDDTPHPLPVSSSIHVEEIDSFENEAGLMQTGDKFDHVESVSRIERETSMSTGTPLVMPVRTTLLDMSAYVVCDVVRSLSLSLSLSLSHYVSVCFGSLSCSLSRCYSLSTPSSLSTLPPLYSPSSLSTPSPSLLPSPLSLTPIPPAPTCHAGNLLCRRRFRRTS